MLISPRFLRFLGFLAWGIVFFEWSIRAELRHDAVTELCGLFPLSADVFAWSRRVNLATLLGLSAGFVFSGFLSDWFGRFRTLLWCLIAVPSVSGLSGVTFTVWDFLLSRFLFGAAAGGVLLSSGLLLFESLRSARRIDALLLLPAGGVVGFLLSLLLGNVAKTLTFLPYAEWRIAFFVQMFPILVVPFLFRFHDEPKCWKTTVRDAAPDRKRGGRRRFSLHGTLLAFAILGGLAGIVDRQTERFRLEERSNKNALLRRNDANRIDAALIALLFRHPAVLDTKGIESEKIDELPNLSRNFIDDPDDLPASLVEGILALHEDGRTIDESSLVDRALERRNARLAPDRPAAAIPLSEIEAFSRKTTDYLDLGNRALDEEEPADSDDISGTEIWRRRLERTQSLLGQLRNRIRTQYESTEFRIRFIGVLFTCGGLFGLRLFRWERSRFGTKRTVLLHFSVLTGLSISGWSSLSSVAFGVLGIPLLAVPLLLLPPLFRTPHRGSACGLCLAVAGIAVLLLFLVGISGLFLAAVAFALGATWSIGASKQISEKSWR